MHEFEFLVNQRKKKRKHSAEAAGIVEVATSRLDLHIEV